MRYTARFTVVGKGEIELSVPGTTECLNIGAILNPTYPPVTITGGSGIYAGASGSGTLVHQVHFSPEGAAGVDTWTGTLIVPKFAFDVSVPTISGAVDKSVRARRCAKRARVTYKVTARDEVDGAVPVTCQPKSGNLLKVGRTLIRCSVTDTSGNTAIARFHITVKAQR